MFGWFSSSLPTTTANCSIAFVKEAFLSLPFSIDSFKSLTSLASFSTALSTKTLASLAFSKTRSRSMCFNSYSFNTSKGAPATGLASLCAVTSASALANAFAAASCLVFASVKACSFSGNAA